MSTIYVQRLKKDDEKGVEDGDRRVPGDCVEVRVGEAGRYVVATRDIQVVTPFQEK